MKKTILSLFLLLSPVLLLKAQTPTWVTVGNGTNAPVNAMIIDSSDYTLVVAGRFTNAGGATLNRLAKWDGGSWSGYRGGLNGEVNCMAFFNNQLIVGGSFTVADGVTTPAAAKYTVSGWLGFSSGLPAGTVLHALCVYKNELYAGTNTGVRKWNGSTWTAISAAGGQRITKEVYALTVYKGNLYAGGAFSLSSGDSFDRIAIWNGSSWTAAGSGADAEVKSLYVFGTDLYIGGSFNTVNGVTASGCAKWDGTTVSAGGANSLPGNYAFVNYLGDLYAYGSFSGNAARSFRKLVAGTWQDQQISLNGRIKSLIEFAGEIYGGGEFEFLEDNIVPVPYVARYRSMPLSVYKKVTNVKCAGGSEGAIITTGYGGTPPYTYAWSTGATTMSLSGLPAGTYTVTVTDATSQTASSAISVTQPSALVLNPTVTDNACDGSACANPSGGVLSYSYSWSPAPAAGQGSNCITGKPGMYGVTVTDNNACTVSATVTLNTLAPLPTAGVTASDTLNFCQGDSVELTADASSSYLWSNGKTTQSITVKTSGNYAVTVSNALGCTAGSSSTAVNVKPAPSAVAASFTGPSTVCFPDSVSLNTAFNTAFRYQWMKDGTLLSGDTLSTYRAGQSGLYQVVVYNLCAADTSPGLSATVKTTAAPAVSGPVKYCLNAAATCLTATGTAIKWYTTSSGGASLPSCPVPATTAGGTVSYFATQTLNGCESQRSQIDVIVYDTPAPSVVSPQTSCLGDSAAPLSATGTSLLWYTAATGGTGSSAAPSPSTATADTTDFWVSQTENGCESPRAIVSAITYSTPAPSVVPKIGYCQNAGAIPLKATGSNLLWYNTGAGGTGSSTAPTPSTATTGSTSYYVSQTLNGCEGPRDTIIVLVSSVPAPGTTPIAYCQNQTAVCLTATGLNLKWYASATGGPSQTCLIPATTVTGTTSYYVSQSINGCDGPRAALAVTVKPNPAAPVIATPQVTYCQKVPAVQLSASGNDLLWYTVPSGGTGSATAPTPSTASAGVTSYYASQTVNGCEGPRDTATITVTPVVQPVISAQGPTAFCIGNTVRLDASGAQPGDTYKWSTNATSSSILVSQPGTYFVVLTNTSGCRDTSNRLAVTVNNPPVPVISANGPLSFCAGRTVVLTTTAPYTGYAWSNGKTTAADTISKSGTYRVVVNDNLGCTNISAPVTVNVTPAPALTVNASGPLSFCEGDSVTLTIATTLPKYSWSTGASTKSIKVKTSGSITAEGTDANGCISVSPAMNVVANPLPQPKITKSGTILSSTSASSYQWFRNGTLITGATQQSYVYSASGSYKVKVTNSFNCSNESDTVNVQVLGIEDRAALSGFEVFPNPFTERTAVEYQLENAAFVQLEVYNIIGARVATLVSGERQLKGKYSYTLSSDALERAGVYFVKLRLGDRLYTQRITKL
jgi:hypothetical protein